LVLSSEDIKKKPPGEAIEPTVADVSATAEFNRLSQPFTNQLPQAAVLLNNVVFSADRSRPCRSITPDGTLDCVKSVVGTDPAKADGVFFHSKYTPLAPLTV
jgi:hypothetical protein